MVKITITLQDTDKPKVIEKHITEGTYRAIMAVIAIEDINILEATENNLIAQFDEEQLARYTYEEIKLQEYLQTPRNGKE